MEDRMRHILASVAVRHGVTEEEVKRQIDLAIKQAMGSDDPEVRERWRKLSADGKPPTAEELICILAALAG